MGRITINELSSDLKEYLNGLGLTEAQVQELIDKSEDAKIGDTSQLNTNSKDLVGAINELFQSANNGKELIASAIGNPLITGDSTFSAMSEAILGLRKESGNETDAREVLYNMMIEDGYDEATSEMTVDELIDLLDRSGIGLSDIKQIACGGYNHTYILKIDGSLWSCGLNSSGQLGLNDTTDRKTFTKVTTNINNDVKQIACGYDFAFVLKKDGSVWSCGDNEFGQLGLNDTTQRKTFTKVTTNINNDVKQIACGYDWTFILYNDGSVWSCGRNDLGQLGLNDNTNRNIFTQVTSNINDVKQIICGGNFTFILKNDSSVWSCGRNDTGQLGLNDTTDRNTFTQVTTNINNDVKQITCGRNFTFIVKNDGSVWSCGYNSDGRLGLGDTTTRNTFTKVTTNINNDVKQASCGDVYVYILKNDGSIWSCGYNNRGQLGLGNTTQRTTFTKVTTNINNDVKQIDCGGYHVFIIKNDGSLWSCGYNGYGQLGLGNTTDRNTFINTNFSTGLSEYDIDRLALYNYLLSNDIEVTESMDIGTMLNLLVDDYINKLILGYENNLKIILTDEGVSTDNEDNMDSLIAKVDEEFDRQVVPAGDAVAANVLSGKTFINSTGQTVTGTMANRGGAQTITPGTSNKTLNAGYYSGNITVAGDADLVAANIVSGKNIFGVNGTATASSLGGKRSKSGSTSVDKSTPLTVSNLGFKPSTVLLYYTVNGNRWCEVACTQLYGSSQIQLSYNSYWTGALQSGKIILNSDGFTVNRTWSYAVTYNWLAIE